MHSFYLFALHPPERASDRVVGRVEVVDRLRIWVVIGQVGGPDRQRAITRGHLQEREEKKNHD